MCDQFLCNKKAIGSHVCGQNECRVCHMQYIGNQHRCYMQPIKDPCQIKKKEKSHLTDDESDMDNSDTSPEFNPDIFNFIFFDFETYCDFDPSSPDMLHKVITDIVTYL